MDRTTPAPRTGAPAARRRNPLINGNYARLWGGQVISNLGDFVFDTTLVVWIASELARDQPWAPLAVSGVLVAATAPVLLVGPLAGVFVDRWDKRRTMLRMDAARAALILLLLVVAATPFSLPFVPGGTLPLPLRLGAIYVVVFLAACCAQFFNPARGALIAHIVPDEDQPQASSLGQMSLALATIVGPPLAAPLLFAFGAQWALLINSLSFVASFLAVYTVRAPQTANRGAQGRSGVLREFGAGLRFFFGNRVLVVLLVALIVAFLGGGAINALDVFFFTRNLHTPATYYGFAGAAYAVGILAGALFGSFLARQLGLLRLFQLSVLAIGFAILVFSRMTSLGPAIAVLFLAGIPQATLNVAAGPIIMRATPRRFLGRVTAVIQPAITIASLASIALAGYLASTVLRDFSATVDGVTFGPLDTIFGVAALLILLGGGVSILALRGVPLPSQATVEDEVAQPAAVAGSQAS